MSALRTKLLLREYVKEVVTLREDMGGDYGGFGDPTGGSPYGMEYVSRDQLYDIFVKPFGNAIGHMAGKTKELSQKTGTLIKTAFEAIATTLIPFLSSNYGDIYAHEKQEIEKIRQQYGKYYQKTWDAYKNDDIMLAAFMYQPAMFLTADLATRAPQAAASLLSVLSGGRLDKALKGFLNGDGGGLKSLGGKDTNHRTTGGEGVPMEGLIREDGEQPKNAGAGNNKLVSIINNEKVQQLIANSDVTKGLEGAGQQLVRNTLKKVFTEAQGVMTSKGLDDLQRKVGKKLPGMDQLQQVPQQERQKAEQSMLVVVKKAMKAFYVKSLESQVKKAIDAGVPQDHPFIHDYRGVISRIKSL